VGKTVALLRYQCSLQDYRLATLDHRLRHWTHRTMIGCWLVECTRTMTGQDLELLLLALGAFLIIGAFIGGAFHDWWKRLRQQRKIREAALRRFGLLPTPLKLAPSSRHPTAKDPLKIPRRLFELEATRCQKSQPPLAI
jgi:hypothetical protein